MADVGTITVGRKKADSEDKFLVVKIDRGIGMKARILAANRGVSMADFLSDTLKGPVEKEWWRMINKAVEK